MEPDMTKERRSQTVIQAEDSIVDLLHRGSQVAEDCFARAMTAGGVTPRQFAVLSAVARAPNANQTEIVNMTGIDRSTMADIVRRLVTKGLLQRRRTREDARAYALSLAPETVGLMRQLGGDKAKAEEILLAPLSQEDRSRLIGMLRQLVEASARQEDQRLARM
jgi:DNA-binding MarR family transcriptional regulator